MKDEQKKLSRRGFILGVGAGGAAAVAAVVGTRAPESVQEAAAEEAPKTDGYRLSEHVRRYYRSTLV